MYAVIQLLSLTVIIHPNGYKNIKNKGGGSIARGVGSLADLPACAGSVSFFMQGLAGLKRKRIQATFEFHVL